MEKYEEIIRKYVSEGYGRNEIMEIMNDVIINELGGAFETFYLMVQRLYDEPLNKLNKEAYEELKVKRVLHAEEKKLKKATEVAEKVKVKTEEGSAKYSSLKEALYNAVQKVARDTGLTTSTVRKHVRKIYPDWYLFCYYDKNITPDYLLQNAQSIVDNKMNFFTARKLPYFQRTIDYVEENRPDLYKQMKEIFASYAKYYDANPSNRKMKLKNYDILVKMILEFRIPLNDLYEFINKTKDIFCKEDIADVEGLLAELNHIRSELYIDGIKWYLYEATAPDDYTEYRLKRFNKFQENFFEKSNTEEKINYIKSVTSIDINGVKKKIINHKSKGINDYGLVLEDYRTIARIAYNYALTRSEIESNLAVPRMDKGDLLNLLESSNELYDKMLVDGYSRLNAYQEECVKTTSNRRF